MLPRDLRRKLSQLNSEREPAQVTDDLEAKDASLQFANQLADVIPGRVQVHHNGELYISERGVEHFRPDDRERILVSMQDLRRLGCAPENALFLDIETCGLANCPLFLIGVMHMYQDEIRLTQLFARDYSEEVSVLAFLNEFASAYSMLVTFNGKSFDVPYMRDRMVLHRVNGDFRHEHLDLLHEARRRWRDSLPNCRLQTLEEYVCGRKRVGDTPGHLIPQLYHDFVRTGNAAPLQGIFFHNALDLITMAELLPKMR